MERNGGFAHSPAQINGLASQPGGRPGHIQIKGVCGDYRRINLRKGVDADRVEFAVRTDNGRLSRPGRIDENGGRGGLRRSRRSGLQLPGALLADDGFAIRSIVVAAQGDVGRTVSGDVDRIAVDDITGDLQQRYIGNFGDVDAGLIAGHLVSGYRHGAGSVIAEHNRRVIAAGSPAVRNGIAFYEIASGSSGSELNAVTVRIPDNVVRHRCVAASLELHQVVGKAFNRIAGDSRTAHKPQIDPVLGRGRNGVSRRITGNAVILKRNGGRVIGTASQAGGNAVNLHIAAYRRRAIDPAVSDRQAGNAVLFD